MSPVGNVALALVLFIVADLAIAIFIARMIAARRKKSEGPIVMLENEMPMHLRRRVEPALRAHRPIGVVEMQVRWRHAAEAHRRSRESS